MSTTTALASVADHHRHLQRCRPPTPSLVTPTTNALSSDADHHRYHLRPQPSIEVVTPTTTKVGRKISDDLGQPVNCISLSNDSNCVLASCLDSTLRLLDKSVGELLQEYKGHTCKSFKMDCCLTNSDAHVTGGSKDGYIYFWDLVDAHVVTRFRAHSSVVTSVSYHPKDECMVTVSFEASLRNFCGSQNYSRLA